MYKILHIPTATYVTTIRSKPLLFKTKKQANSYLDQFNFIEYTKDTVDLWYSDTFVTTPLSEHRHEFEVIKDV